MADRSRRFLRAAIRRWRPFCAYKPAIRCAWASISRSRKRTCSPFDKKRNGGLHAFIESAPAARHSPSSVALGAVPAQGRHAPASGRATGSPGYDPSGSRTAADDEPVRPVHGCGRSSAVRSGSPGPETRPTVSRPWRPGSWPSNSRTRGCRRRSSAGSRPWYTGTVEALQRARRNQGEGR